MRDLLGDDLLDEPHSDSAIAPRSAVLTGCFPRDRRTIEARPASRLRRIELLAATDATGQQLDCP
jgi:hypothetical protein